MSSVSAYSVRIGLRARQLREAQGLSAADVVRHAGGGVDAPTLSRLEKGKANWLAHHIEAVARGLGVDPRDLLPGPEPSGAQAPPASAAVPRENPAPALPPAKQALLDAVDDAGPEALAAAARVLARALEAARG